MDKEQCLQMMRLLSALESWSFATQARLPDYLHEWLHDGVAALQKEILK